MTIKEALTKATKKLETEKIASASLDAELLLALALKKSREFLFTYPEQKLTYLQRKKLEKLIKKRADQTPLSYLTGFKEFYGLSFIVSPKVLVPRPLTEELVERALEELKSLKKGQNRPLKVAEIGTGSGCLIISLIKELQKTEDLTAFEFYATDISKAALKVAKKNAKKHEADNYITFLKGDLLKPLKNKKLDLILANLPYLTKEDVAKEGSIKKEPEGALIGDYNNFFKQIDSLTYQPLIIYEDKGGINLYS